MLDISDEVFLNENRQRYEWESRYTGKGDGTDPKCRIRMEAAYLIVLFAVAFIGFVLNYNCVFCRLFRIKSEDIVNFQKVMYCLLAGLLGGVTFDMKIFYRAVARGYWNVDRVFWRVFSPLISVSVTCVVAFFMADSVLKPQVQWAVCVGYFAGYFSENAVGKMCEIAAILFTTAPGEKKNGVLEEGTENADCTEQ